MQTNIKESLYFSDNTRFKSLKLKASAMNIEFIGDTIVQDEIFRAIYNYCKYHDQRVEIIRFPIKDQELCACTFLRDTTLIVYVNSDLPLAKQVFAAAHEFYHIYCYLEEKSCDYKRGGSILRNSVIDCEAINKEDKEANAFAGLVLAPEQAIENQIKINNINVKSIEIRDLLKLVEIFGIPYKAMVIRLLESGYITQKRAEELINEDYREIQRRTGFGRRWLIVPIDLESLGSLEDDMYVCEQMESVSEKRINEDKLRIKKIKETLNWI